MFTARRPCSGDPRQTNADIAEISISIEKCRPKRSVDRCRPMPPQNSALHCYNLCDNPRLGYPPITKK